MEEKLCKYIVLMITEVIEIPIKIVTETKSYGGREGQKSYNLIKVMFSNQ